MATANLGGEAVIIASGLDSVVIRKYIAGIDGGRTLDVSGYPLDIIKAGHVIIRSTETGEYKPLPIEAAINTDPSLPDYRYGGTVDDTWELAGVLVRSVPKGDARAAVMYAGEVNDKAMPYSIDVDMMKFTGVEGTSEKSGQTLRDALKAALPTLVFLHD